MDHWEQQLDQVLERKTAFAAVFIGVFAISFGVLYLLDFYPEPPTDEVITEEAEASQASEPLESEESEDESNERENSRLRLEANTDTDAALPIVTASAAELPESISFPTLGRTVSVLNPQSRSIADLDAALLNGAVRHPDSATFTNEGTIFVLGHSSYLPNVMNKNYQAFNGIQNLKWGDTIELTSADTRYVYRVEKVYQAKASEVTVPIAGTGPKLVIATCNSFASKDDRYMVEAKLISTVALSASAS